MERKEDAMTPTQIHDKEMIFHLGSHLDFL